MCVCVRERERERERERGGGEISVCCQHTKYRLIDEEISNPHKIYKTTFSVFGSVKSDTKRARKKQTF